MTALTAAPPVSTRPVPWHRLAWVAWRRLRPTLTGLAVVLAALSTYLVVTGQRTRTAYDAVAACRPPADSPECQFRWSDFVNAHGDPGIIGAVVLMLPGIVGAFVGGPLIARELETGVFRYSWTQGVGRLRWAIGLVVPAAVGVAVAMWALGLLVAWRDAPLVDAGTQHRLDPSIFPTTGVAVAGWALLAFSGGVLAGLLWRRVVPAIATTFGAWFGLAFLGSELRLRWPAPLTTTGDLKPGDLEVDQWWTHDGVRVGIGEINAKLEALGAHVDGDSIRIRAGNGVDPFDRLREQGYTMVHSYQPDSRYWDAQWMELGVLAALSVVLLGLALWQLRRVSV